MAFFVDDVCPPYELPCSVEICPQTGMFLLLIGGWREREKAREDSWGPPRESRPSEDREWDRDKDRDENEKDREFDKDRDLDREDRFRRPRFDFLKLLFKQCSSIFVFL